MSMVRDMHKYGIRIECRISRAQPSPDNTLIRAALAQRVPCPAGCHAGTTGDGAACPRCEGKGTVQRNIPGAKLLDRGGALKNRIM